MQQIARPIERCRIVDGVDDHFAFVEYRDLQKHMRQVGIRHFRRRHRNAPGLADDEFGDVDRDEKNKTAADRDEADDCDRQDDLENESHELDDKQRCIPFELIFRLCPFSSGRR